MDLKDVGYIVGIVGTAIATFLTTKHNLKEYVRDKLEDLKDKLHKQEVEIERLNGKNGQIDHPIPVQIDHLNFRLN